MSLTDSVRVVELGNGQSEQRTASLNERDHPWVFAAQRHMTWLVQRLKS